MVMEKVCVLVDVYVWVGFWKIYFDCFEGCVGEVGQLGDVLIVE